ncbi:MAG: BMP family ABC transporter substrate-binding protein [Thermotogae bacterium]|nr:BMP family ABC transporter substrate-binding protein [Thermotogota bacterium]
MKRALVVWLLFLSLVTLGFAAHRTCMIIAQPKGEPFASLAYSGLELLQSEMGENLRIKLIESLDKSEHEAQVRAMAELGYNPVLVLWDDLANAVLKVAPDFPDTKFIIVDSYVTAQLPNVKTIVIEPHESSFIAGVVAAETTKTKKVGFVGGADYPIIERFFSGFAAGIKYVDPAIQIVEVYAGTFTDPAKGLEIGTMLFKQGCDIVMHAANKTGLGVIKAAENEGKWAIGVDLWQGDVAPGHVLWSALKDVGTAVYIATKEVFEGKFQQGLFVYDLRKGMKLYDERDLEALPPKIQKEVLYVEWLIRKGKLKVPMTKEELKNFNERLPE